MIFSIDETNWILYAAKHYDNVQCYDMSEFREDLKRIKYVKKLLTRYEHTGEIKERLVINHLVVLGNVFGPEVLCRILFLKMEKQLHYLKPFLLFLNCLPSVVVGIGKDSRNFVTDDIPMDMNLVEVLRKI